MSATERPDEKPDPQKTRNIALRRAIKMLSYRSRTYCELVEGLRRKGIPENIVVGVAAELEDRGLLDDSRLARDIVCGGQTAGKSRSRIYSEMRRRGIAREVAEESMRIFFDAEREREEVYRLLLSSLPFPPVSAGKGDIQKAARRLSARGFSASAIADVIGDIQDGGSGAGMLRFLDTDSQLS